MRRLSFPTVWDAVRHTRCREAALGDPAKLGMLVERVGHRVPGADTCLPQALAAVAMLRRWGHRADLVLGVRTAPVFEAHAWVEVDGAVVVGEGEASRFSELWRGR